MSEEYDITGGIDPLGDSIMKQFTTSEITEGLDILGDFLDAKGYTEEAGLCTRAMGESDE